MDRSSRERAASALLEAYASRVPIAPLIETYPRITIEDAYEIQLTQIRQLQARGAAIKGHKVGLTSLAVQRQLGVDQPDCGFGGVVLGSVATDVRDVDLPLVECVFRRNGEILATGTGAAVLGSPLNSLAWLANTIGALGATLEPGHVVLSGSITPFFPALAGDTFTATFGELGSVTARFANEA